MATRKPAIFSIAMIAALAAALAAGRFISGNWAAWSHSVAGWSGAIAVMLFAHLLFLMAKRRTDGLAAMQSLGIVIIRLLSLIILLVVVLVSDLFEALPFAVGLMAAYFAWSWTEIGCFQQN